MSLALILSVSIVYGAQLVLLTLAAVSVKRQHRCCCCPCERGLASAKCTIEINVPGIRVAPCATLFGYIYYTIHVLSLNRNAIFALREKIRVCVCLHNTHTCNE